MILPIGHQESTVRRWPWVTFGIMTLCTVAWLLTPSEALYDLENPDVTMEHAGDFWRDHAYLDADPKIVAEVGYDVLPNQRRQYLALLVDTAQQTAPVDLDVLDEEQAELDHLTDLALGRTAPSTAGRSQNPYRRFGLVPASPSPVAFLTHMFMHAGWLHLLGNLFMLFLAGPALEDRWGRPLFAAFYLLSGLLASFFYLALNLESTVPMVGASGAIAGCLGAFLVMFAKTQIRFAYFFFIGLRVIRGTFESPAWVMLPLWFGNELLQAAISESMGLNDGIAYWAHVGGFLAGGGAAFAIVRSGVEQRFIHDAIEAKVTLSSAHPAIDAAYALREESEHAKALEVLATALQDAPDDVDLPVAYWDTAVEANDAAAAAEVMRRFIRSRARAGELELAANYWTDLNDRVPSAMLDPDTLLRIIPALLAADATERAVHAYRLTVDSRNTELTAGLALRIADQARELDPPTSLSAAERALKLGEWPENKRERLQQQIEELRAAGVEPAGDVEIVEAPAGPRQWERGEAVELPEDVDISQYTAAGHAAAASAPKALELSADGGLDAGSEETNLAGVAEPLLPELEALDEPDTGAFADLADGYELSNPDEDLMASTAGSGGPAGMAPLVAAAAAIPSSTGRTDAGRPVEDAPQAMDTDSRLTAAAEFELVAELEPVAELESIPTLDGLPALDELPSLEDLPELEEVHEPEPAPATEQATPPSLPPLPPLTATAEPTEVSAAAPPDAALESPSGVLDALADEPRFTGLKQVDATPTELGDGSIHLQLSGSRKSRIEYDQIDAIAVGAIAGLSAKPVVVVDLLLNWSNSSSNSLRTIRLRSDRFNPRTLTSGIENPAEAFRHVLSRLLGETGAVPLPDRASACGRPFQPYDDLATYHREVLKVSDG